MHFDQECNDNQHQCPEKLVCSKVRLHGSHWQKAHHCFHIDTLKRQRYHLILSALHHQLYVSLTLDAQGLGALDEQLKRFAVMLAHIQSVDSGMKFSQQVQDSNNPSALRNL